MLDLVIELIRKIEKGEGFYGNEKELALLDAEEFMTEFDEYSDKLENLQESFDELQDMYTKTVGENTDLFDECAELNRENDKLAEIIIKLEEGQK